MGEENLRCRARSQQDSGHHVWPKSEAEATEHPCTG